MTKRIFAVIGIVIGSALALAGAIVGIFAAMGKFKEPVVYPETLVFQQSSLLVDQNNPVATTASGKKIYSFVLTGTSTHEYEVNRKSCYLSFTKGNGIIVLCSQDGTPLTPNQSNGNQYLVNCNEPIYYYVNTETTTAEGEVNKVGTVVLSARDERGAVWCKNELTINVDSAIETIYIDAPIGENGILQNSPMHIVGEHATQNIELSLGGKVYINNDDYLVKPSNTLKPFTDKDAKEIELYYVGPEKHHLINEETLTTDLELKEVLKDASGSSIIQHDDNLGYYFTAMAPGTYQFKIAYFSTYNEKEKFEADSSNAELTGYFRVEEMQHTILTIKVQNTVVDDVYINGAVNLNLYLDNNYLTIGGEKTVTEGNNSVLGLVYSPSNQQTALRYNEAVFVKENNINLLSTIALKASDNSIVSVVNARVSKAGGQYTFTIVDDDNIERTFNLSTTSSKITKTLNFGYNEIVDGNEVYHNRILVTEISEGLNTFTTSGMLVIDGVGDDLNLKLLPAGTYLDFYVENTSNYDKWLNYEAEFYNRTELTGKKSTWKIIAKEELSNVVLGTLVVNNNGTYCFRTVKTSINPQSLSVSNITYKNERIHNLTIQYDADYNVNLSANGSSLNMAQIFEIPQNVSYRSAVLFTPLADDYSFDVVSSISYVDEATSKEYVLVGYVDEETNRFVNRVRVNKNAVIESSKVYVAQLKNGFNVSTEEYVSNYINAVDNAKFEVAALFNQTVGTITINVAYDILVLMDAQNHFNAELVDVQYSVDESMIDEDKVNFIKGTTGTISIAMRKFMENDQELETQPDIVNILNNIYSMLGETGVKKLFSTSPTNVQIESVRDTNETGYELNLIIGETLTGNSLVNMTMSYAGRTVQMLPIKILSKNPQEIEFAYGEDFGIHFVLNNTATDTNALAQLTVEIDWEDDDYTYVWKHGDNIIGETLALTGDTSNFKILPTYAEGTIEYSVLDLTGNVSTNVIQIDAENIKINGVGSCILKAKAGDAEGYILVNVVASENFKFNVQSLYQPDSDSCVFATGRYIYDLEGESNDKMLDDKIQVVNMTTSNANHKFKVDENNNSYILYYEAENSTEIVLLRAAYEQASKTWKFTRESDLYSTLQVIVTLSTLTNGSKDITIQFNPSLAVDKNWKNLVVYKGTTVNLYEVVTSHTNTTNAMFKIVNTNHGSGDPVQVYLNGSETPLDQSTRTFAECGTQTIEFKTQSGVSLTSTPLTIKVVPNAIINITNTSFNAGDNSKTMFEAYTYKIKGASDEDIVYGKGTIGEYPSINSQYFETYTERIVENITSSSELISSIAVKDGADNNLYVNIPASKIVEVDGGAKETITILYNAETIPVANMFMNKAAVQSNQIEITIASAYSYKSIVNSVEAIEDVLDIETLELLLNETSNVVISAIEIKDLEGNELSINNNRISTLVSEPTRCEFVFTLTIDGVEGYKLTKEIVVNPYVPLKEETQGFVYSEETYELIGRIFNVNFSTDEYITEITAKSLIVDGNNTLDYSNYFKTFGFGGTNVAEVTVKELDGDNAKIVVVFEISYVGGGTYEYEHELIIKNRDQYQKVYYPYDDIKLAEGSEIKLVEVDFIKHSAGTLTSETFATINGLESYEPVILGQTIDLAERINKKARVNVKDMLGEEEVEIAEISIYAASNSSLMSDYIYLDKQITITGTKIEFGKETVIGPVALGYIKFKFTTTNGNVGYYNVRLYDQLDGTSSNVISATSNQNIEYVVDANNKFEINSTNEYSVFGETLDVESTFKMKTFDSTKVSMYLLNVTSPAEVVEDESGIQVGGETLLANANYFQKLNVQDSEIEISKINNYATICVALVYRANNTEYCFGTLTIYVKPTTQETVGDDAKLSNKYVYNSGFYTKEIAYTTQEFEAPFANITEAELVQKGVTAVEIKTADNYSLNFVEYVQEDLTFNVLYTINDELLINVEYTLKSFNFNPQTQNVQVGKFITKANGTKEFANYLAFEDILDGYSKAVKISINDTEFIGGEGVVPGISVEDTTPETSDDFTHEFDLTISTGETGGETGQITFTNDVDAKFTFPLFSVQYKVIIKLTFVGYAKDGSDLTKEIEVTVLPGIYVENKTSATTAIPIESVAISNSYSSENGSKITFAQGSRENNIALSYSVGENFVVYLANGGYLNITYTGEKADSNSDNIVNYVNLSGDTYSESGKAFVIDGNNQTISFPHMANGNKIVSLNLGLIYNDKPTTSHQGDGLVINVKLAQTYSDLQLNYLVAGSDNENVVKGVWGNAYDKLFADDATQRISLINAGGTAIIPDGGVDFTKMGFKTPTNPNCIKFNESEDMVLTSTNMLSFNAITASKENKLTLSNLAGYSKTSSINAGVEKEYKFYILKEIYDDVDGIDFADGNNIGTNNVSYLVGSTEGKLVNSQLGTLTDGANANNVFSALKVSMYKDNEASALGNWEMDSENNIVALYSVTTDYGTFFLTIDSNKKVYVEFDTTKFTQGKDSVEEYSKLCFEITLTGDTDKIFDDFNVILYNYDAPSSDELSAGVLATSSFDISSSIAFKDSNDNEISGLTYKLVEVKKNDEDIIEITNGVLEENPLITYNDETGKILTKNVPENTLIRLKFVVYDGEIYITTINFRLTIENSIQYVVNGNALDKAADQKSFTTNYNLYHAATYTEKTENEQTVKTFDSFPLEQSLIYDEESNNNILSLRLFSETQYITDFGNLPGKDLTNVTISVKKGDYYDPNKTNEENLVYIKNRTTLVFNQDITTTLDKPLILLITHTIPNNDPYVVEWIINVTGLLKVDYISQENTILSEKPSGTSVDLTMGLKDDNNETNNIYILEYISSEEPYYQPNVDISARIDYVINKETTTITNLSDLFAEDKGVPLTNFTTNGRRIQTSLPVVEHGASYTVTYRIYISYMAVEQGPFYASYMVRNTNSFAKETSLVNVDEPTYIVSAENGDITTKLNMFSYYETYKNASKETELLIVPVAKDGTYEMRLIVSGDSGNIHYTFAEGAMGGTSRWINGNNAIELINKEAGTNAYSYRTGTYNPSDKTFTIDGDLSDLTRIATTSNNTVISSDYTSIKDFVDSINQIKSISFTNLSAENGFAGSGDEKNYTLKYDYGRYTFYIDLAEGLDDGKLFNNSLTTDLKVKTETTSIFSIDNFELTTSNVISEKSFTYLSTIFTESQYGLANKNFVGHKLIGVFDNSTADVKSQVYNWIKTNNVNTTINANCVMGITEVEGFEKITSLSTNNTVGAEYMLYQIEYSIGSESVLYNVTAKYYAIGSSTGNITLVDYASHSLNPDYFYVEYDSSLEDAQSLGYRPISKYTMDEYGKWNKDDTIGNEIQHTNSCIYENAEGSSVWEEDCEYYYANDGFTYKFTIVWQAPSEQPIEQ